MPSELQPAGTDNQSSILAAMRTYLLAIAVGLIAGTVGSIFHLCLDQTLGWHTWVAQQFADQRLTAVLVSGTLGGSMALASLALVRKFAPEAAGSGIQEIEGAIVGLRPLRWARVIPVKFVGGALALGSGLVLGREGPTVHLGGCIGKLIGEKTRACPGALNTLVAAGAAAGLSAAFGAPLAGVLFVFEEMRNRFNLNFVSLHAVALASFTANVANDLVFGAGPSLPIELRTRINEVAPLLVEVTGLVPLCVMLGIVVGLSGAAFNQTMLACLNFADRQSPRTRFIYASALGAIAGALLVTQSGWVGGGDILIQTVFSQHGSMGVLLGLLIARGFMTFLSYSAGVPGGIFAPMLALGALIGMILGSAAQTLVPDVALHPGAYALAAMGGFFAASVRAPLTGIVLVAELTASFDLLPSLMITCIVASVTAQFAGSKPIYDLLLARTLELQAADLQRGTTSDQVDEPPGTSS